jgi:hypothetical protein
MNKAILAMLLLGPSTFAQQAAQQCPDFSGLYVTSKAETKPSADGKTATTSTAYEYLLIDQTGCEKIAFRELTPSGVKTRVEAVIGTTDWQTADGYQYKAGWKKSKLEIEAKINQAEGKMVIRYSKYDDGLIEIQEYNLKFSVPVTSAQADGTSATTQTTLDSNGRETRVWERLR